MTDTLKRFLQFIETLRTHKYYVVEEPLSGYTASYENSGVYAQVTDRAYSGGKIVNTKTDIEVPSTGDNAPLEWWTAMVVMGLLGIFLLQRSEHKKRRHGR